MDDLKQDYRNVTTDAKKAARDADGESVDDKVGNIGDDIRRDLGNAGDQAHKELRDADRDSDESARSNV